MKQILLWAATLYGHLLLAQNATVVTNPYKAVDEVALAIPAKHTTSVKAIATYIHQKFNTENDKVRAAFAWVTANITYDINNLFALNFYESQEEKIKKALATRTGICEHFALLFTGICTEMGLTAYTVEGFTKQNGFVDYIPHAWSAVKLTNTWLLFDPTWGSGYINNKKFIRKLNNNYYKVSPEKLIKTHMPFDYLWQFLYYPVTSAEFNQGKTTVNKSKPFFNFVDSIAQYNQLPKQEQLLATAARIEKNGVSNAMIFDRLRHLKVELENMKIADHNTKVAQSVDAYNHLTNVFNNGIILINKYIDYKNRQFTPGKPDAEIKEMFDTAARTFTYVETELQKVDDTVPQIAAAKKTLVQSFNSIIPQLQEQKLWLEEYMSKSKSKRKAMFYERKITWFGIPIN